MHIASLVNEPLFPILLGITVVPREIENNGFAKFGGWTRCIVVYVKMVNSNADWQ